MNRSKLREAEARFLKRYPGGFSNPMMLEIAKKHKVEKMNKLAQDSFSIENFENPDGIVDSMKKIIGQSSMVSVFEKPKFRDLVSSMNDNEKSRLSRGLEEFLHGDQHSGFALMSDLLNEYNLAKWTLLTACPLYYRPDVEVFIKPTTVFEFYQAYRGQINQIKKEVDASLQVDNGAFCGFLMMSIGSFAEQE